MIEAAATRLRDARERAGVTRAQLAAKIGISQSTLRAHENGQNGIQPEAAKRYAAELGTSPQWILYGLGDPIDMRGLVKPLEVPIVGAVRPGYLPDRSRISGLERGVGGIIRVGIPGFEGSRIKAYEDESRTTGHFLRYVLVAPWAGEAFHLVDEVVVRTTKSDLAEIDVWNIGASEGWMMFYKGKTQSSAHDIRKIKLNEGGQWGQPNDFWILGTVVGRFEHIRLPGSDLER